MPPSLHFLLLRHARYTLLFLGAGLTVWYWSEWHERAAFLLLLPAVLLFFVIPLLLRVVLRAHCPGCNSKVSISEKEHEHGFREYIYRCRSCTHQHHTGVFFKPESQPAESAE